MTGPPTVPPPAGRAPEPAARVTLAELLARWEAWSMWDALERAHRAATTSGDTEAATRIERVRSRDTGQTGALAALAANHELAHLLTGWQWHAVRGAREHGASWQQIAEVLDTSPDHARQQYVRHIRDSEAQGLPVAACYHAVAGPDEPQPRPAPTTDEGR